VRRRTYASALPTYPCLVSGFSIFFGIFVFALLVEWARIEVWQVHRQQSRRQDKVVLCASDPPTTGVISSLLLDQSPHESPTRGSPWSRNWALVAAQTVLIRCESPYLQKGADRCSELRLAWSASASRWATTPGLQEAHAPRMCARRLGNPHGG